MIEGQESGKAFSRLRYGMVGGGQGSFIGDVHRKAIAMDGHAELVAGCFSQEFDNTLATGRMLGLEEARLYRTYEEMITWSVTSPSPPAAVRPSTWTGWPGKGTCCSV